MTKHGHWAVRRATRVVGVAALALLTTPPPGRSAPRLPPELSSASARIDVAVRAGAGGPPLAGALVQVFLTADDAVQEVAVRNTGSGGMASFDALPRGELWIVAQAKGRARGSVRLVSQGRSRAIEIDLVAGHTIKVAVRDEIGSPITGADVDVASPGDPWPVSGRTGSDGTAEIAGLAAGPWTVTGRCPGYDEATDRIDRESATSILVLRKLGALLVRVVREGGATVDGARVSVAGATLWPARSATTDAHGSVRIGGLSAGMYALRAVKGDLVSETELGVPLQRGEQKAVSLRLGVGRYPTIRVMDGDDPDADPIAGADVVLAEGGLSPFPLEAVTDARGRARLGPVASGGATVGVWAEGFVARGGVSLADPFPAETRITLARTGTLLGTVVDAHGDPIAGATIEIVGTDAVGAPILDDPRRSVFRGAQFEAMLSGPLPLLPAGELGVTAGPVPPIPGSLALPGGLGASATSAPAMGLAPWRNPARPGEPAPQGGGVKPWLTDEDGAFAAAPASPGRVQAVVTHPNYVTVESEIVTLPAGGSARVRVVMRQGGTLEGRVLDAHDEPIAGARLVACATRGPVERTSHSASDGTFGFAALPDQVSLSVYADDQDLSTPAAHLVVEVPEGGRKEITVSLPVPREPIHVTVVDSRGDPVTGAELTATSLSVDVQLRQTAFTDAQGEALITHGRGVPLRLRVHAPSFAPGSATTDGASDALRIELVAAETVQGDVVTARGQEPVARAEVTFEAGLESWRAATDAQGRYVLRDVAPGTGRLTVHAPGLAPSSRKIDVPDDGGRRPFEPEPVELVEGGSVHGRVVDVVGAPVAGARVALGHAPTWLLVGSNPPTITITDSDGAFTLRDLAEGPAAIEAYAPDLGRGRASGVQVVAGRTIDVGRIALGAADAGTAHLPVSSGGVALTLGEAGTPVQVVVASVVDGSGAQRGGIAAGDELLSVDDQPVRSMEQARSLLNGPISDDVLVRVQRNERVLTLRLERDAVRR